MSLRLVAIGGGHGLSGTLKAVCSLGIAPTAIVTVADDGGSSGRLRRDLGIIAPGDLRMALLTLARNMELAATLGHRFQQGELAGHALGNLFLVALAEQHGGFVGALRQAGRLLDCQGAVLPSTTMPVALHAEAAGQHLDGQVRVQAAAGQIERVWLEPERPSGCAEALAAIEEADVVVLGPGSLFTSVIVNLLVPDIAEAVRTTAACVVHVANVRTQPGETTGLDLDGHLSALLAHLGGRALDATLLHTGPVDPHAVGEPLTGPVTVDRLGRIIEADLVERDPHGNPRESHDPSRLAAALRGVLDTVVTTPTTGVAGDLGQYEFRS